MRTRHLSGTNSLCPLRPMPRAHLVLTLTFDCCLLENVSFHFQQEVLYFVLLNNVARIQQDNSGYQGAYGQARGPEFDLKIHMTKGWNQLP